MTRRWRPRRLAASALLGLALGPTGAIQSWLAPVVGEHAEESPVLPAIVITLLTLALVAVGASKLGGERDDRSLCRHGDPRG